KFYYLIFNGNKKHPLFEDVHLLFLKLFYFSHTKALAPRIAASASSSSLKTSLTLFLKMGNRLRSMCSFVGFKMKSPALITPPKRRMASGEENITKFAKASPNFWPVYLKTSMAVGSPFNAHSYTTLESISSSG